MNGNKENGRHSGLNIATDSNINYTKYINDINLNHNDLE